MKQRIQKMKWKILVIAGGIFFAGEKTLVEHPCDAKWFNSYVDAVEQSMDIVALNIVGVTQVRFISEVFDREGEAGVG